VLVVVLVHENPDRFAIRLTEQNSCRTSVYLRSRNPNAPRTSTTTTTRTIPNFGIWVKSQKMADRDFHLRTPESIAKFLSSPDLLDIRANSRSK
jgi:hypothetical protein